MTHSPEDPRDREGAEPFALGPPSRAATWTLVAMGALLVVGGSGWLVLRGTSQRQTLSAERERRVAERARGARVATAVATLGSATRKVELPGEIQPKQITKLYAKVPGYLRHMLVDKGDKVAAGQILGVVESPETDEQLIEAKSNLLLKEQLVARLKGLVGGGVVSKQEMDQAMAELRTAKADVARVHALQDYTNLRAPFAGVITARYVDNGALLPAATAGTGSAQPLVELQDHSRVRIWTYLGQAEAPYVAEGATATIGAREAAIAPFLATVTRTSHALDARSRTLLVEFEVDNAAGHLTPGLFVDVSLCLQVPRHIEVPSDALIVRGGQTEVVVVTNGRANYRRVVAGRDDGRAVQILEGLTVDEVVGLHVSDEVEEGAQVQPIAGHSLTGAVDVAQKKGPP